MLKRNCFPTAKKIVDLLGGIDSFSHVRLDRPPFMRLCLEKLGDTGPRGLIVVSVAHYYEQNGDLVADPEICYEIDAGMWFPISYRQDSFGIHQEGEAGAVFVRDGKLFSRPGLVKSLTSFTRQWSINLADQGFLDAAKQIVRGRVVAGNVPQDEDEESNQ